MKKRGFGAGRWNGFGGKIRENEAIDAAAARELKEETGLEVSELEKLGILDFEFKGNPEILEVHIFKAFNAAGELTESDEMEPRWFHINELPFDKMWPDDTCWFPLFLAGKKFKGRFLFDETDKILEMNLQEAIDL